MSTAMVTRQMFDLGYLRIGTGFFCDLRRRLPLALEGGFQQCFDPASVQPSRKQIGESVPRKPSKRATRKVTCDDCYFRCNLLCALELDEPCATFRPNEAQLAPPQQLRFVFRQERRSRAAWAFPSAQEQAALHA
jgi:hypothetical protein